MTLDDHVNGTTMSMLRMAMSDHGLSLATIAVPYVALSHHGLSWATMAVSLSWSLLAAYDVLMDDHGCPPMTELWMSKDGH